MEELQPQNKLSGETIRSLVLQDLKFPVVFKNSIQNWNLMLWSTDDWIQKIGEQKVPFRVGYSCHSKNPCWESKCITREITMQEFFDCFGKNEEGQNVKEWLYFDYKYAHQWLKLEEGDEDVLTWSVLGFPERSLEETTLWIGSKGGHTPCHQDTYGCNLVAQIQGRKQWILFPPESSSYLRPTRIPYEESSIYSDINFYSPNDKDVSVLKGASAHVVTLERGDVLFVPKHWWHFVENLEVSISVNTWIELPSDERDRAQESLVKLWFGLLSQRSSFEDQDKILNPNEMSSCSATLPELLSLVHLSMQRLQEYERKNTTVASKAEKESKKRKLRGLENTENSGEGDKSLDTNVNKVLKEFSKDIVKVVCCTSEETESILKAKRDRFLPNESESVEIVSDDFLKTDEVKPLVKKLSNAYCSPNVLAEVLKVLSET